MAAPVSQRVGRARWFSYTAPTAEPIAKIRARATLQDTLDFDLYRVATGKNDVVWSPSRLPSHRGLKTNPLEQKTRPRWKDRIEEEMIDHLRKPTHPVHLDGFWNGLKRFVKTANEVFRRRFHLLDVARRLSRPMP